MTTFAVYSTTDGSIKGCGSSPDLSGADIFKDASTSVLDSGGIFADPALFYVRLSDATLQVRAALPAFSKTSVLANGIDAAVIASGLPNPTHVTVSGDGTEAFDVTDGALSLAFSAPGRYKVTLDAGMAYVVQTSTIVAT